ncbi:MAG TPA: DUF6624 domain-containing protein [Candidatus Kapabacteria bacterium]|nr:DUF6624 domain-containing protein [Candidatus Kapabacteria bacterium]
MQSRFAELDALLSQDFSLREELIERGVLFGGYHPEMETLHIANGKRLEFLIEQFGWPDASIDGSEAIKNAWYIVMHAISLPTLQRRVLKIFKSTPNASSPEQVAMLEDRTLVFSGKKQRFGTQVDWDHNRVLNPFPIENLERVNILRANANMPSLKESLTSLRERALQEVEYPPINIAEYTKRREDWMLRVGWIRDKSEIDPAYSAFAGLP